VNTFLDNQLGKGFVHASDDNNLKLIHYAAIAGNLEVFYFLIFNFNFKFPHF
jgi:hypothetical protein